MPCEDIIKGDAALGTGSPHYYDPRLDPSSVITLTCLSDSPPTHPVALVRAWVCILVCRRCVPCQRLRNDNNKERTYYYYY